MRKEASFLWLSTSQLRQAARELRRLLSQNWKRNEKRFLVRYFVFKCTLIFFPTFHYYIIYKKKNFSHLMGSSCEKFSSHTFLVLIKTHINRRRAGFSTVSTVPVYFQDQEQIKELATVENEIPSNCRKTSFNLSRLCCKNIFQALPLVKRW